MKRITEILGMKRPHGGLMVEKLAKKLVKDYGFEVFTGSSGEPLALVLEVGEGSRTLFSSHLDTVHRTDGRQILRFDEETQIFSVPVKGGEVLGADDGAGIWLMLEMIDAKVPGVFVCHYGEEKGGIGSSGMAEEYPEFLKQFDRAVAFDRRGSSSVITHQGWGRCCSDNFAEALCDALNNTGVVMYQPDNTGVFTDTANYTALIPECTNLSCGYLNEHTAMETLDFGFLKDMREALIKVDWESLPVEREAKQETYSWAVSANAGTDDLDDMANMSYKALLAWVTSRRFDPDMIADVLYEALARMDTAEREIESPPIPWDSGSFREDWV